MFSKEELKAMFIMQDFLNDRISEGNWTEKRTSLDFLTAIHQEVAELIDDFPWKWWKHYPDLSNEEIKRKHFNTKIELVDIWHFVMSFLMVNSYSKLPYIEALKHFDNFEEARKKKFIFDLENKGYLDYIRENLFFMEFAFYFYHNYKFDYKKFEYIELGLVAFMNVVEKFFLNPKEFITLYFLKNALNEIRRKGGYGKEYKKVINGVEDNELLKNFVETSQEYITDFVVSDLNKENADIEKIFNNVVGHLELGLQSLQKEV